MICFHTGCLIQLLQIKLIKAQAAQAKAEVREGGGGGGGGGGVADSRVLATSFSLSSFVPHSMLAHSYFSYFQSEARCSDIVHSGSHKPQDLVSCSCYTFNLSCKQHNK